MTLDPSECFYSPQRVQTAWAFYFFFKLWILCITFLLEPFGLFSKQLQEVLFRVGFLGCDFCNKPERWPKFSSGAIWEVSEGRGTWSTSALFSFWGNVIKRFISKWGDNSWLFPGMCCKYHFNSTRSFVNVLHIWGSCGRINEVSDQSANVAAPRRRPERWSSCSPVHRSDLWPLKP